MERKLNIIDCPGSDDFCGSLFSAFKVGDVGVMVFNAQNGWEVGSEIQARYSRELSKPLIGVINQLDAEKANFEGTVESIRRLIRQGEDLLEVQDATVIDAGHHDLAAQALLAQIFAPIPVAAAYPVKTFQRVFCCLDLAQPIAWHFGCFLLRLFR